MKATFENSKLRDEFESTKATRDASKSRKGWYASRKAQLRVEEAFAEIEDEIGHSYRRGQVATQGDLHAPR